MMQRQKSPDSCQATGKWRVSLCRCLSTSLLCRLQARRPRTAGSVMRWSTIAEWSSGVMGATSCAGEKSIRRVERWGMARGAEMGGDDSRPVARQIVVTDLCGMLVFAPLIYPFQERVIPMQTSYNGIPVPANGQSIEYSDGKYKVPDHPLIPFIEG